MPNYLQSITLNKGDKHPHKVTLTDAAGNVTVSSVSYSLYAEVTNTVVLGPSSGSYEAAAPSVDAWYNLDTASLTVGNYIGVLTVIFAGSDGISQTSVTSEYIILVGAPDSVATCNLATDIGKLRLKIYDIDLSDPFWTDAQLNVFLTEADSNQYLAAAKALEAELVEVARGANSIKIGIFADNEEGTFRAMRDMAARYRELALNTPTMSAPAQVFQPYYDTDNPGTMETW